MEALHNERRTPSRRRSFCSEKGYGMQPQCKSLGGRLELCVSLDKCRGFIWLCSDVREPYRLVVCVEEGYVADHYDATSRRLSAIMFKCISLGTLDTGRFNSSSLAVSCLY